MVVALTTLLYVQQHGYDPKHLELWHRQKWHFEQQPTIVALDAPAAEQGKRHEIKDQHPQVRKTDQLAQGESRGHRRVREGNVTHVKPFPPSECPGDDPKGHGRAPPRANPTPPPSALYS